MSKEHNFISAVVYLSDDSDQMLRFFDTLTTCLDDHFLQYELIAVNGDSFHNNIQSLKEWSKGLSHPLAVINMSLRQPHEQCMNAGIDIAIGDYVYEFDSVEMPYSPELIWKAYQSVMLGNDIVTVCPKRETKVSSMFYKIFNCYSNAPYELRTDAFRIVSRRAINRAHAINENLPYRKAAYAACGLKMATIEFNGIMKTKEKDRFDLATDSLVLYTDFGYRFTIGLTLFMSLIALMELLYTIIIWFVGKPISGWTTTMFVLTLGLTGLFAILAVVLKYQSLLLRLTFHKQSYQIEGIEKL